MQLVQRTASFGRGCLLLVDDAAACENCERPHDLVRECAPYQYSQKDTHREKDEKQLAIVADGYQYQSHSSVLRQTQVR